jgi:hypothetical protein
MARYIRPLERVRMKKCEMEGWWEERGNEVDVMARV